MTHFKALLMTAALLAAPSVALAQISTDAMTDKLKDKAVEGVMDNMTTDDALIAGKTLLKGGSKEDAAMAIVKGRAEDKIEGMMGKDISMGDLSKDGMIASGKEMMMDKAAGSATTYGDTAAGSATTHDAAGSATTYETPSIPSSDTIMMDKDMMSAPAATPINCPSGTKDAGDGTCMITGNWIN